MKITIPEKIRWLRTISASPIDQYSPRQRRSINSLCNSQESSISHEFVRLDQSTVDWFTPIYTSLIGAKRNAVLFDIAGTTLNINNEAEYWILLLRDGDINVGGIIFSVRADRLNMAYKALPQTWPLTPSSTSPSLYADFLMSQHTQTLGKQFLSHGKDRNPYGINADIGLAIFKLSVGCLPYVPEERIFTTIDLAELTQDALIFSSSPDSQSNEVKNGILWCTQESIERYNRVTRYPGQVLIEVRYRTECN